ncbi:hypothetical protein BJV74DRAFT_929909 [Russula compacta]|nr:hypothetical protein BJV74DRAFT_929909 [Russula compacta]
MKLSWTHPEFGSIFVGSFFDHMVKIWEETPADNADQRQANGTSTSGSDPGTRWVERAVLADAKGCVHAIEFALHQFGLNLAHSSSFTPSCACSPVFDWSSS